MQSIYVQSEVFCNIEVVFALKICCAPTVSSLKSLSASLCNASDGLDLFTTAQKLLCQLRLLCERCSVHSRVYLLHCERPEISKE